MMLRLSIISIIFFFFLFGAQAQTLEEYMKEQKSSFNKG